MPLIMPSTLLSAVEASRWPMDRRPSAFAGYIVDLCEPIHTGFRAKIKKSQKREQRQKEHGPNTLEQIKIN